MQQDIYLTSPAAAKALSRGRQPTEPEVEIDFQPRSGDIVSVPPLRG